MDVAQDHSEDKQELPLETNSGDFWKCSRNKELDECNGVSIGDKCLGVFLMEKSELRILVL